MWSRFRISGSEHMVGHNIFLDSAQEVQHRLFCATADSIEPVLVGSYGVIGSRLELGDEVFVADAAQSGDIHSSVDGLKEEKDRLLDDVNRYNTEKEQFHTILSEIGVAIKTITTSLLELEKIEALLKSEEELLWERNADMASTVRWQGARGSQM